MKTLRNARARLVLATALLLLTLGSWTDALGQLAPSDDAYVNSAKPTINFGTSTTLNLQSAADTSYIRFDLTAVPAGYTGASIAKATLKLYVNSVTTAGSFNVDYVNGTWAENTITYNLQPAIGTTIASSVPLTTASKGQYVQIDVTSAMAEWLNGTQPNDGIALVANSPLVATFDSKENTGASHPAEIDIVYAGIAGVTTANGSGLMGGGNSGTLNLALTNSCSANQVLQWNGSAWVCASAGSGTITGVTAGTGLTGGGTSGGVTLNLDTTKVPLLNANNALVGSQAIAGSLQVTDATGLTGGLFDGSTFGTVGSTALTAVGGAGTTSVGGIGLVASGGLSASGTGGVGIEVQGGNSTSLGTASGGTGITAQGGSAIASPGVGGTGGIFLGGTGSTGGAASGGDGLHATGAGSQLSGAGNGINATGGDSQAGPGTGIFVVGGTLLASNDPFATAGIGGFFTGGKSANVSSPGGYGIQTTGGNATSGVGGVGIWAIAGTGANGPGQAGLFSGDVTIKGNLSVTGTVAKGGGSFKIDHPLDPANQYLSHSFVESPDMMNIYNGNTVTDAKGQATVILPKWFEALNRDFRYQLTVIGQFAQAIVAHEVQENHFSIQTSKPHVKVSWQVTGIRHDAYADANRIPVEEDKGAERGTYLHPELFPQR